MAKGLRPASALCRDREQHARQQHRWRGGHATFARTPFERTASAACIRLSKFAAQRAALDGADSAKAAAKAPPPAKPSQAAAKPASTPSAPKAAEEEGPSKVMAEYKANEAKERGPAALKRGEYRTAAEAYHEACKLQPSVLSARKTLTSTGHLRPNTSDAMLARQLLGGPCATARAASHRAVVRRARRHAQPRDHLASCLLPHA